MNHLVLIPNRKTAGPEFTGEFTRESRRYAKYYTSQGDTVTLHEIDVSSRADKLAQVQQLIASTTFDVLVFFCHGWRTGIQLGLGIGTAKRVAALEETAKMIAKSSTPKLHVVLYCCLTGGTDTGDPTGDGGFADRLRDALCAEGCTGVSVFAHTTAGHTTRNANVRFFVGSGSSTEGKGGVDVVTHKTPESHVLYEKLHDANSPFRWQIPFLSNAEIRARLV
jgi:hypothetical protein